MHHDFKQAEKYPRITYTVHRGDKISQLVIIPCMLGDVVIVDEISEGERGENGFGSTGR